MFIFWYEDLWCTVNSTMYNSTIVFLLFHTLCCMFLKVFRTALLDVKSVCSFYPSLFKRTPNYSISLYGGAFSATGRYQWKAPLFADRKATFCIKQKTLNILEFTSARLSTPIVVTKQIILFY